ncbi:MAG: neutral/alkaline non-lysosomal ceramidase N-terminal domain-containing protein [Tateyamaria sp.]|uniref:neutral/alkaline non-lysosomal ceramidase N-terminal domain-containing protein n=1 Tax=Tateyamaria sp. TaxID=1929288 RepID=UPI00329BDD3A
MGDIYKLGTSKQSLEAKSYLRKPLQGFNDANQKATQVRSELYARAFVVEKGGQRIAFIVADIWSGTKEIKQALLDLIAKSALKKTFLAKNLMVSGTHTHAGPAGITGYKLYTFAGGELNKSVVERIAKAMFDALLAAWKGRQDGTIEQVTLDVTETEFMGGNRSTSAYDKNYLSDRNRYKFPFDTEITSLVFRAGTTVPAQGKPAGRVLGVLSWLAMHCNSLGSGCIDFRSAA